jgi:hypothetical protein
LNADGKDGRQQEGISNLSVKTLELNPTELLCEFSLAPGRYFNFPNNIITLPANLIVTIKNDSNVFDQKTIRMLDESTIQPSITIIDPLRGSEVAGDFLVTTKIENSALWLPDSTLAGAFVGATSNCSLSGNFAISELTVPNRNTALYNQYSGNKEVIVTQLSENTFRYQFFQPGQYTICFAQSFIAKIDSKVKSDYATAAVIVNVSSAVSNLTYDYNDPIFKKLGSSRPYNFVFKCPKSVSAAIDTYECSIQAQSKLTTSILRDLGLTSATTIEMTGRVPLVVCEYSRGNIRIACENDSSLVPSYFSKVYLLNVGFDTPVKFKVKNHLKKYGYTGVEISGNSEPGDPKSYYAWKMNDYDAKMRQAANTPPSASYQVTLSKEIKSSLNSTCQKLPTGFSKFSVKYSKKITSYDGIPGYIFVINGKTSIQIFEMGNSWQFGPSSATADQKTWKAWGCGGAIWIY